MRYRGGGIGHKSIREATLCLFDDRDALDKQEFNLEHDRNLFDEEAEGTDDDVPMDDSSSSDEESGDESESEESAMEDINPACSERLIDDELGDEMDDSMAIPDWIRCWRSTRTTLRCPATKMRLVQRMGRTRMTESSMENYSFHITGDSLNKYWY